MTTSVPTNGSTTQCLLENAPLLTALQLTEREYDALRRQGFVSAELRGNCRLYKLRFRLAGQQRALYLGTDARMAAAVEVELAVLQHDVRRRRQRAVLGRAAAEQLTTAKHILQPLLEARGFYFHGLAIRQRRVPKPLGCRD